MKPNYVAKKSVASVLSFWLIVYFWAVIPLIIQIARILSARCYSIEFYDNKIVVKSGVIKMSLDSTSGTSDTITLHYSFCQHRYA